MDEYERQKMVMAMLAEITIQRDELWDACNQALANDYEWWIACQNAVARVERNAKAKSIQELDSYSQS